MSFLLGTTTPACPIGTTRTTRPWSAAEPHATENARGATIRHHPIPPCIPHGDRRQAAQRFEPATVSGEPQTGRARAVSRPRNERRMSFRHAQSASTATTSGARPERRIELESPSSGPAGNRRSASSLSVCSPTNSFSRIGASCACANPAAPGRNRATTGRPTIADGYSGPTLRQAKPG